MLLFITAFTSVALFSQWCADRDAANEKAYQEWRKRRREENINILRKAK